MGTIHLHWVIPPKPVMQLLIPWHWVFHQPPMLPILLLWVSLLKFLLEPIILHPLVPTLKLRVQVPLLWEIQPPLPPVLQDQHPLVLTLLLMGLNPLHWVHPLMPMEINPLHWVHQLIPMESNPLQWD